jgi:hypothetical protein
MNNAQHMELVKVVRVSNAVAAGVTNINCTHVDMTGFDGVEFIAALGALTATQVTAMKAQMGAAANDSDMADITGAATAAMADGDSKQAAPRGRLPADQAVRPGCRHARDGQRRYRRRVRAALQGARGRHHPGHHRQPDEVHRQPVSGVLVPNAYVNLAAIKAELVIPDTSKDAVLLRLVEDVSRSVEDFTKRRYYAQREARYFDGEDSWFRRPQPLPVRLAEPPRRRARQRHFDHGRPGRRWRL